MGLCLSWSSCGVSKPSGGQTYFGAEKAFARKDRQIMWSRNRGLKGACSTVSKPPAVLISVRVPPTLPIDDQDQRFTNYWVTFMWEVKYLIRRGLGVEGWPSWRYTAPDLDPKIFAEDQDAFLLAANNESCDGRGKWTFNDRFLRYILVLEASRERQYKGSNNSALNKTCIHNYPCVTLVMEFMQKRRGRDSVWDALSIEATISHWMQLRTL